MSLTACQKGTPLRVAEFAWSETFPQYTQLQNFLNLPSEKSLLVLRSAFIFFILKNFLNSSLKILTVQLLC